LYVDWLVQWLWRSIIEIHFCTMVRATVARVIGLLYAPPPPRQALGRQVIDNGAIGRNQPSTVNLMGF
jgi:hypothetical protein